MSQMCLIPKDCTHVHTYACVLPKKGSLPGKALESSQGNGIFCLVTMCSSSHKEYAMPCVSCVE